MSKKEVFKRIFADFFERDLREVRSRSLDIPVDVQKIVSLLGARRSGKTYLLFQTIKSLRNTVATNKLVYINFEDDRLFPLQLADMDTMLEAYYELYPRHRDGPVWFFFDEIQEVPHWEKFIRRLYDTENCRIYVTSSSSKLLSRELASALRGRTLPFEVFPLNFEEFLHFNDIAITPQSTRGQTEILHWFDRWLDQGGFPELVFLEETFHRQTVNEYLDLMLYRDLTERFSIRQPSLLKYMLKFLLENLANPISLTKAFRDLKSQGYQLSKNTLFDYVAYLEEAYIVFRADIWKRSVRAQSINPSKYYTLDPAFKYAMSTTKDRGRVLENAVYLHLRRQGLKPHYLKEKQEVDFFWKGGEPVNVCLDMHNQQTQNRELKGMLEALQATGLTYGRILTRDQTDVFKQEGKTIEVQPAWQFFLP